MVKKKIEKSSTNKKNKVSVKTVLILKMMRKIPVVCRRLFTHFSKTIGFFLFCSQINKSKENLLMVLKNVIQKSYFSIGKLRRKKSLSLLFHVFYVSEMDIHKKLFTTKKKKRKN